MGTLQTTWEWRGHKISYRAAGELGDRERPALVLIHGFGASSGHWRKNIPALATEGRVYALDLLGFGASAKPAPSPTVNYTFATWGKLVVDFCQEIVGTPVTLAGNSIGAIVAMQAAHYAPSLVLKTILLNCSLRQLHEKKRVHLPWYQSLGAQVMQNLLAFRPFAQLFFAQVRQPQAIRQILQQAYAQKSAITPELVEMLQQPAYDPGALDVFVAFVRYSGGPTPEELLETLPCPAVLLWGTEDPWEPIGIAQTWQRYPAVQAFIPIVGAGHCPQDELPQVVNPLLLQYWLGQEGNT
ncbi:MAG: alpha/beta fold hydrolase [Pseudanabaenaceae cyanobacterium SKYGB_i_bin29]|nr:alpha/beta fold hydrolase [Pseudanabaenaceae cyanobacterium SKYG29]MDW8420262.1 alpha/beta fold hydrolase [Pseudanabaenaceae cyanobacterium SKYGB_i_bin29]